MDATKYVTCLVGTTWSLVPIDHPRSRARRDETLAAGGIVRPATAAEVSAWQQLQASMQALRDAGRSRDAILAALADDMGGFEQMTLGSA